MHYKQAMSSICERLSHEQRKATPLPFARYLVSRVREMFCVEIVAILWVQERSNYWKLYPGVEMWGIGRNARTYSGPHPVICHPPCGPWGKLKWKSRETRLDGICAMEHVHKWGGIVEQPLGSELFDLFGLDGKIENVNQGDFGHRAPKPTILYVRD